jgi:prepilin-type N-terminal cleavage/methylation domain-containing protein
MKKLNKLGFTLIELLVVITIIAILATVWINQFGKSLQKARDSKRTSDILTLKTAVTQAFTDEQEYPAPDSTFSWSVSDYVDLLPIDWKSWQTWNSGSVLDYVYTSWSDVSGIEYAEFEISTAFEASTNIKNVAKKDNWDDDLRKEIWNVTSWFNTKIVADNTCAAISATVSSSTNPTEALVIKWSSICKAKF